MSDNILFTRENIDKYFNELAKAYKKAGGRTKIEIVIVGGVSVLINYDFRISSMDVDVDYSSIGSVFKDWRYKNDLSDIAGIMYEQKLKGEPLTFEKVDKAVTELYGDWNKISDDVKEIFIQITNSKDLAKIYSELSNDERQAKETLKEIEKKYQCR